MPVRSCPQHKTGPRRIPAKAAGSRRIPAYCGAMTPDDRDRRILRLLQDDAWLSYAAIARKVHLSASAVQRRVERLIEAGILLGAKAVVAQADGARPTTIFLLAELIDDTAATIRQFERTIAAQPEVVEAHYV